MSIKRVFKNILLLAVMAIVCWKGFADDEISLKEDRSAIEELRKEIPPEVQKENDDLKDIAEIDGPLKMRPEFYRRKFDNKMRKERADHRKEVRKSRENKSKDQRKAREEFKKQSEKEKVEFKKQENLTRELQKEFYREQDLKRKEFYDKQRDDRKEFDAQLREKSRNFDSYYREKKKEFDQQYRIYKRRWQENEREKQKQKLDALKSSAEKRRERAPRNYQTATSPVHQPTPDLSDEDKKDLSLIDQMDKIKGSRLKPEDGK
ncbi:MAG: hypothetical protein KDD61_14850 [Bdellovibrionales bacterium]|nr:hypothetical protein [Bdellovibrionales bacterium]